MCLFVHSIVECLLFIDAIHTHCHYIELPRLDICHLNQSGVDRGKILRSNMDTTLLILILFTIPMHFFTVHIVRSGVQSDYNFGAAREVCTSRVQLQIMANCQLYCHVSCLCLGPPLRGGQSLVLRNKT